MSEQATPILDQFLAKSLEYPGSAEAFLKSEVPAFIQEFMAWQFYQSVFMASICLIALTVGIILVVRINKASAAYKKERDYEKDSHTVGRMVSIVGIVLSSVFLSGNIHTLIKIKVAPRVFLLEEVRSLTR